MMRRSESAHRSKRAGMLKTRTSSAGAEAGLAMRWPLLPSLRPLWPLLLLLGLLLRSAHSFTHHTTPVQSRGVQTHPSRLVRQSVPGWSPSAPSRLRQTSMLAVGASSSTYSSTYSSGYSSKGGDGFTAVMVVPTGVGASIGGYAGDALPAARLLAEVTARPVPLPPLPPQ
jgi:hypothetical protein